jgi:hypothetical protein
MKTCDKCPLGKMTTIYNVQKLNGSMILAWFRHKEDAANFATLEGNCKVNEIKIFSSYEECIDKRRHALAKLTQEEKDLLGL